jgi:hypothetical protein
MNQIQPPKDPMVLSYLGLRRAVGIIGCYLPFVLIFGKLLLQSRGLEGSISSYYYTMMGDVFVGSMCAIGIFLMSCRGYDRRDTIAGHLACIFAVGVALFPTAPETGATPRATIIGGVHLICATLLFLTLAYFCLALFTQTSKENPTEQKIQRNRVYVVCGSIILLCIGTIAVCKLRGLWEAMKPTLWLESAAILAFGVAWLTKGEAILKDEETQPLTMSASTKG